MKTNLSFNSKKQQNTPPDQLLSDHPFRKSGFSSNLRLKDWEKDDNYFTEKLKLAMLRELTNR